MRSMNKVDGGTALMRAAGFDLTTWRSWTSLGSAERMNATDKGGPDGSHVRRNGHVEVVTLPERGADVNENGWR